MNSPKSSPIQKLEHSDLLKAVADNASLGLVVMDENQHCTFLNPAAENILGYSLDEIIELNKPLHDIIHHTRPDGSSYPMAECPIDRALPQEARTKGEDIFIHQDGHFYPVAFTASPIIQDGKPVGTVIEVRDTTEEKEIISNLLESEARFRNLADTAPILIAMTDETGSANYFNRSLLDFTGRQMEDLLGDNWVTMLHPEDAKRLYQDFRAAVAAKGPVSGQYRMRRADGEYRWMLAVGAPRIAPDGRLVGFFGTYTDIHERMLLEQQKDDFLAIASHELKTPVTSIKAYSQLLERRFRKEGNADAAESMHRINVQLNKLTKLMEDLLDVTKIESGKLPLTLKTLKLDDFLSDTVSLMQESSEKHQIILSGTTQKTITTDSDKLQQVLINLISNAIKYSPKAKEVLIRAEANQNSTKIHVQDFGIGIPSSRLDHLFERFYRVGGPTYDSFPGLGLGLYISAEILKRLGGEISVHSEEEKGSTFTVTLPLNAKQEQKK